MITHNNGTPGKQVETRLRNFAHTAPITHVYSSIIQTGSPLRTPCHSGSAASHEFLYPVCIRLATEQQSMRNQGGELMK